VLLPSAFALPCLFPIRFRCIPSIHRTKVLSIYVQGPIVSCATGCYRVPDGNAAVNSHPLNVPLTGVSSTCEEVSESSLLLWNDR
jgi:hypothetical protein